MATTLKERVFMNGAWLETWEVDLTGQTEITLLSGLGSIITAWGFKNPTRAAVPFYEIYVNIPSTRGGTAYVWCSDTTVTDKVFIHLLGKL